MLMTSYSVSRRAGVCLAAVLAFVVFLQQLQFRSPPVLRFPVTFEEDLSPRRVRVYSGVVEEDGGNGIDGIPSVLVFRSLKNVEISTKSGDQSITPGLFFEVLAMGSVEIRDVSIVNGGKLIQLAESLRSETLNFKCCGDDSELSVPLSQLTRSDQIRNISSPILEFLLVPSGCSTDVPKIKCRFVRISGGLDDSQVGGGYLLISDLSGIDLSNSILSNIDFRGTSLAGADLRRAMFRYANLREVDISRARRMQTMFVRIQSEVLRGRP